MARQYKLIHCELSGRREDEPELPLRSEPPATMEWSPDHGPGSPAVAAAEMVGWGERDGR